MIRPLDPIEMFLLASAIFATILTFAILRSEKSSKKTKTYKSSI